MTSTTDLPRRRVDVPVFGRASRLLGDVALALRVAWFVRRRSGSDACARFLARRAVRGPEALALNQVHAEIERFCELVRAERPRAVLELGTAGGGTLFLLSDAAADDATLVSVDLPPPRGYRRSQALVYRAFARGRQRVVPIRGDSHDPATLERVREQLRGRDVDVLFVDGDHSADGVARDHEMYGPLVRPGGLIAFHDVVPGREDWVGGVPGYWRSLKEASPGETLELVEDWSQGGWGIGVLRVGPRQPDAGPPA